MDWDLKNWAADPHTLKRGAAFVQRGAVTRRRVTVPSPGALAIEAEIEDGQMPVRVRVNWDGKSLSSACSCPMNAPCKHALAVAIAHMADNDKPAEPTAGGGLQAGQEVLFYSLNVAPPPKKLEKHFTRGATVWLALEKAIVREDGVPGLPRPLPLWGPVPRKGLSEADCAILDVIEPYYRASNRDFSSPHAHGIPLKEDMVATVFAALTRCPFVFGAGRQPVTIRPDMPIRDVSSPYETLWDVDGTVVAGNPRILIGAAPGWLQVKDAFRPLSEAPVRTKSPLDDEEPTEERAAPDPGAELVMHAPVAPSPRLTLSEDGDRLVVKLSYRYAQSTPVSPADPRAMVGGEEDGQWGWWNRDVNAERDLASRLAETSLESRDPGVYLGWGEEALTFLLDELPRLIEAGWEIFGEERLSRLRVSRKSLSVSVGISSGIDWFDIKTVVEVDGQAVAYDALVEALKRNSRFVRLGDGAYARLPEEWLSRQRQLSESLGFSAVETEGGFTQQLPRYLAPAARELLESADDSTGDVDWRKFLQGLESVETMEDVPQPKGFQGELRHYQAIGLTRLSFWRDHGLHGILADDMGLGKTIQAIALMLSEKEKGQKGPSILVAPTSVVYNWEQEIAKFGPDLKVLVLHGSDRHARFDEIPDADVVVTSYGLLQRDKAILLEQPFNYVILDEAQKIKNPRSQAAKLACKLQARHRLCLTGTPIENNLLEFWSLFHFLMPGLLGTEKFFRQTFFRIDPTENEAARERLRRLTRPFILRRLKQDVATDLPPRSEIVSYCELSPDQRKLYDETLLAVRGNIFAEVQAKGLRRAHFHVLEGLLRLRQVACDPRLVMRDDHTSAPPSAKVEQFMEMLKEMIDGGHRVLVFSQFVKMLHILRDRLGAEGIAHAYLDGQTKDRLERVQKFNADDTPVFLISLKAGGTGLNLTGADYVIHFDPWWNPAVEDQATDRAHRIGQTRHVFSYKLIAKDTVEEKVLSLQAQKRQMVRDVLGNTEAMSDLTMEDLEFLLH